MSRLPETLIVTGGSRGIGAATCKLAAKEMGLAIVVNYAGNKSAAETVVTEIEKAGGKAVAVQADVGKPEDIARLFAAADELGPLAGLVNNAGVIDMPASVVDMTPERLERMWRINISGSFLCAAEAVRRMSTALGGAGGGIVNITSAAAKLGAATNYVDYAASKGAIDTFTVGLAMEVADQGIRVNGVRPGLIATEIHASGGDPDRAEKLAHTVPQKRVGTAEEVAEAIVWLLSDKARYTTGTVIGVTGGRASIV